MAILNYAIAGVLVCAGMATGASAATLIESASASGGYSKTNAAAYTKQPGTTQDVGGTVGAGTGISPTIDRRAVLEFGLQTLPQAITVTSAYLGITFSEFSAGTIVANGYSGDGAITVADLSAGSDIFTVTPSPLVDVTQIDVTAFIDSLLSSGSSYAGFGLRQVPLGVCLQKTSGFCQSDVHSGDYRVALPTLTINYDVAAVPEPATWSIMILGMGMVGFVMRRRTITPQASYAA